MCPHWDPCFGLEPSFPLCKGRGLPWPQSQICAWLAEPKGLICVALKCLVSCVTQSRVTVYKSGVLGIAALLFIFGGGDFWPESGDETNFDLNLEKNSKQHETSRDVEKGKFKMGWICLFCCFFSEKKSRRKFSKLPNHFRRRLKRSSLLKK